MFKNNFSIIFILLFSIIFFSCSEEEEGTSSGNADMDIEGTWLIESFLEIETLTTNEDVSVPDPSSEGTGGITLSITAPNDSSEFSSISLDLKYISVEQYSDMDMEFEISNHSDSDEYESGEVHAEYEVYCNDYDFNNCSAYFDYDDNSNDIYLYSSAYDVSVEWDGVSFTLTLLGDHSTTDWEDQEYLDISLSGAITSAVMTFEANVPTVVDYDEDGVGDEGFYGYVTFHSNGTATQESMIVCSEVEPYNDEYCDYGCSPVYDSDGLATGCEDTDCSVYSNEYDCDDSYACLWDDDNDECVAYEDYYDYDYDYYIMLWEVDGDELILSNSYYGDYSATYDISFIGSDLILSYTQAWCDYYNYYYNYYGTPCNYDMVDHFYGMSGDQITSYTRSLNITLSPATIPSSFGNGFGEKAESPLFKPRMMKHNRNQENQR